MGRFCIIICVIQGGGGGGVFASVICVHERYINLSFVLFLFIFSI